MAVAEAQTEQRVTKPTPEAKLLSSEVVGSNLISQWLVRESSSGEKDFSIRYQINLSQLVQSFNGNSEELNKLDNFINSITEDETKSITRVDLCGYASPDGVESSNDKLAIARANDCRAYITKKYPSLANITGTTKGIAQPWSATKSAISASSIPDKSSVLSIINSSSSEATIEDKLRDMTAPWDYIIETILPPMRCVEIDISYDNWAVVETITPVEVVGEIIVVEDNGDVEVVEIVEIEPRCILLERYQPDIMILGNERYAPIDFDDQDSNCRCKFKDRRRREKMKLKFR